MYILFTASAGALKGMSDEKNAARFIWNAFVAAYRRNKETAV
jgi:hypothetical protein